MKEAAEKKINRNIIAYIALKALDWIIRIALVCLTIVLFALAGEGPLSVGTYILLSLADIAVIAALGAIEHLLDEKGLPAYKRYISRLIKTYEKKYGNA